MSTLHTLNKSSFSHTTLASCLAICLDEDGILLIEDGVYCGLESAPYAEQIQQLIKCGVSVFALGSDVTARGLQNKIQPNIEIINYDRFVELSITHRCVQSWY
jgi:tRNA 2-thiouridine synthesizing protein B